ncbi:DUF4233 domain-containing protein [Dermacoccaceae bacterium W4C1]
MIGRIRFYGVGEKMTRRLAAVTLAGEVFAFFFGALVVYGLDRDGAHSKTFLWLGIALAVLTILASGMLRRPWGITLGWFLQVALLAWSLLVPSMLVVAACFIALWITSLFQGHKMDELTARYIAEQETPA